MKYIFQHKFKLFCINQEVLQKTGLLGEVNLVKKKKKIVGEGTFCCIFKKDILFRGATFNSLSLIKKTALQIPIVVGVYITHFTTVNMV